MSEHLGQREDEIRSRIGDWLRSDRFSCLAGKAALRRDLITYAALGPLGAPETTAALHRELEEYVSEQLGPDENFATFIAVFDGPAGLSEERFEAALWQQLSDLHEVDRQRYAWAPEADPDPESPRFAFSAAGHPFFVVGLHDGASRISRRSPLTALAFNSHHQFERLKQSGVYSGLQRRIREREMRLQQSINPNLDEFGLSSEARQYSGRTAEPGWTCPFRPVTDGS
ncbi:guanitoxin biosynthesis heme-dependent pre-guanitoxin N-hydroxylase GntA [Streptomyces sp. NPDC001678]|uniref:guanitoxin biosynthesis heme-dependent pre-guanitoxin N-hydroxylase GntA n=1 Tax=Streptomyces sp. NPDC001678 TaxID=3364599 RepID=UPI0036A421C4